MLLGNETFTDTEPSSSSESSKEEQSQPVVNSTKSKPKTKQPQRQLSDDTAELWQEVRRRNKNPQMKNKEARDKIRVEREELDFQFDEELEVPMGKINTFSSDWTEEETDEVSDKDINKLLIVTQCHGVSTRLPKHEGYDRTGDWTTRVKITQDLEQEINDGLYYYQEDLWTVTDRVSINTKYF